MLALWSLKSAAVFHFLRGFVFAQSRGRAGWRSEHGVAGSVNAAATWLHSLPTT